MDLSFSPWQRSIGLGIVLFLLGATGACTSVQTAQEPSHAQAPAMSDAALAARVRAALHASPVNDAHIDVSVQKGDIVLTGLVEDARALIDALQAVQNVADGHTIVNEMSIMKNASH